MAYVLRPAILSCCSCGRVVLYHAGSVSGSVAGIVCLDGFAIVADRWQSCFALLMRMADSGLWSSIGIGDYLNLSIAFLGLNNNSVLACFPAISDTC